MNGSSLSLVKVFILNTMLIAFLLYQNEEEGSTRMFSVLFHKA